MFKYFAAALLLMPSLAFAGQATGSLSVGMRIIADPAVQSTKSSRISTRPAFLSPRGVPFRRYVVRSEDGLRIQTTEF